MSAADRADLLTRLQALDLKLMQASLDGSLKVYRAMLRERQWIRGCLDSGRLLHAAA